MYHSTVSLGVPPVAHGALAPDPTPPFPNEGYVRLRSILAPRGPVPVSKSTLWEWVSIGKFPRPVKLSPKITAWKAADVQAFLANPRNWEA